MYSAACFVTLLLFWWKLQWEMQRNKCADLIEKLHVDINMDEMMG